MKSSLTVHPVRCAAAPSPAQRLLAESWRTAGLAAATQLAVMLAPILTPLPAAAQPAPMAPSSGPVPSADAAMSVSASTDPVDIAAEQARRCEVPPELAPLQDPLPGLARVLRSGSTHPTIVVLGPQESGARSPVPGVIAYPARLQARLATDLLEELGQRKLTVDLVGRTRGSVDELASLINRQVLALKPALVVWQVGRADARRGNPAYRFAKQVSAGLDILKKQGIDTIVLDIQYHPQFEALYRTDEYRHHLRWVTGKQDLPLLQRYEMIEYWEESGRVDLDSSSADIQKTSFDFIQDCLAFQIARMIVNGVRLVPQSGWAPAR